MHSARFPAVLLALMSLCAWVTSVRAMTVEEIEARKAEAVVQVADPALRQQIEQLHAQARASIESRIASQARLESLRKAAARQPETRRKLADEIAELARLKATPPITQRERTLDATALENLLELTRSERASMEGKLSAQELKLRTLTGRPGEIAGEKAAATARLTQLAAVMSQISEGSSDPLTRARLVAFASEVEARQSELDALEQELLGHEELREITGLRREAALLNLERLSARMTALEELLIERREASIPDAQAGARTPGGDLGDLHPWVRVIAEDSIRQGEELAQLLKAQSEVVRRRAAIADQRQRLSSDFETSRQRLQVAGASSVLGRVLVDQRRRLPRIGELRREATANADEVTRVSLRRIEIEEQLRALAVTRQDPVARQDADLAGASVSPEVVAEIRNRLDAQESLLRSLDTNYSTYLRMLDAAESELQRLTQTVTAYRELLDQRLLWIPNASPWSSEMLRECATIFGRLLDFRPWTAIWNGVAEVARDRPLRVLGLIATVAFAFHLRSRLRASLGLLAERQLRAEAERARDTLAAMFVMLLMASPPPLLWYVLSTLLQMSPNASPLALTLAQTLKFGAVLQFCALWWQAALGENGLFVAHLGVESESVRRTRAAWKTFARVFVPTYALALNFDWQVGSTAQSGVARVLFAVAMLSLLAFVIWLNRRGNPLARMAFNPLIEAARPAWRIFVIAPPLGFALLSAVGYHYAAAELSRYFLLSGMIVALAVVGYRVALRWLRIAAARMRTEEAMRTAGENEPVPEPAQIAKFDAQARQVVQNVIGWSLALGLIAVWHDVLPALSVFDSVNLWSISVKDATGATTLQSITLTSVFMAALFALVTMMAFRNLPGLLEFSVLQRLHVTRGSRYAVTSLLQYAIVALGLSIVLSTLGMRWSQVQWLVAALGVGLGFGLQEIFANFISGLILLFERPIRVGDVVTIDSMTGQVTRIRIRATTIKDADNKEIVVPNKTFITDRFVNWTLSDQVTRVVLQIGIAYGADVERAVRLLIEIAGSHPKVMRDPAPLASLTGFGDSALTLELAVHAEELRYRGDVRHELNTRIYHAFREHGIEIPFPQRDIHIRSGELPQSV
ncbi:MAG: mechanosensitive ion channel domain-containing protein [Gammaproteobacteria bacterium]